MVNRFGIKIYLQIKITLALVSYFHFGFIRLTIKFQDKLTFS